MTARDRLPTCLVGAALMVGAWSTHAAADAPIKLTLPLNCKLNVDCFVQNYVDHDPGPGAADYTCGTETYDRHDGTDFRVADLSGATDLQVRAVAAGRVLRTRDGMADMSIRRTGEESVAGKECGNGVVIDHGAGWQTQYCHLAKDSVSVRRDEAVAAGQAIGRIGMSGLTEFPHVHVTVRFQGQTVDPFAFGSEAGQCGSGAVLWELPPGWHYFSNFVITSGFTDRIATADEINAGALANFAFTPETPELLAAVMAGGLSPGAVLELTLAGPDGKTLATKTIGPLAKPEAQHMMGVGLKRPKAGWPAGAYRATFHIRNGDTVTEKQFQVQFSPTP